MGQRTTLSQLEYDVLWEHLRLGPFQPVLTVPSPGVTPDERAELRATAWASLTAKGLGHPDSLDDRLARRLARLARPEWELDARLWLSTQGPRTSALLARAGRSATVAVLGEESLTLWAVNPDQMVAEAVRLLPAHPAGTGGSVSLPATALDRAASAAGADRDRFARALVAQGLGRSEARKVTDVFGDVVRQGQFGAARTRVGGGRRRASYVVSVYDNPGGRYLAMRKKDWVTLLPGTEQALTRQLAELLAELDPDRP
ncbi:ESX secretion-associated protein EspG [Actinophytocola sediminis]